MGAPDRVGAAGGGSRPRRADVRLRPHGGPALSRSGGRRLPGQRVRDGRARGAVRLQAARGGAPTAAGHRPDHWLAAGPARLFGVANDVDWTRRVGHVAILAGLVWALGTGRVSLRSSALGLGAGLASVIGLAAVGIGGDNYPGRLTGYLGDPNAGAYFIVSLGVLAIFFSDDRWKLRLAWRIPLAAGLVLSFSRTGLLASAFAVLWLLVGRSWAASGAALAGGLVWVVANIPEDLETFGPFSTAPAVTRCASASSPRNMSSSLTCPGSATARAPPRSTSAVSTSSSTTAIWRRGRKVAGSLSSWSSRVGASPSCSLAAPARLGDLHAAAAQAAIVSVAAMAITLGEVLLDLRWRSLWVSHLGQAIRTRPDKVLVSMRWGSS